MMMSLRGIGRSFYFLMMYYEFKYAARQQSNSLIAIPSPSTWKKGHATHFDTYLVWFQASLHGLQNLP